MDLRLRNSYKQVSSGNYYTAGKNGNWYFGLSPTQSNVVFYTYDAQSNSEFVNISQTISLNSWHHAAAVRSGNTVTLYLNGISIGSGTVSKDLVDGADGGLQIGRLTVYGSHMGYISNFRILNGEALYTADFTPPFTELKAIRIQFYYVVKILMMLHRRRLEKQSQEMEILQMQILTNHNQKSFHHMEWMLEIHSRVNPTKQSRIYVLPNWKNSRERKRSWINSCKLYSTSKL